MGAAAGVVVNDNLVLIDYILKREEKGDDRFTAIINAAKNRFRPILLTTLTTLLDSCRSLQRRLRRRVPQAVSYLAGVRRVLRLLCQSVLGACALPDWR